MSAAARGYVMCAVGGFLVGWFLGSLIWGVIW